MDFEKLYKTDVKEHIEKKGKFSYLSWPYAVAEFRKACPEGSWNIQTYGENQQPYCQTDAGCFVMVTVYPEVHNRVGQGFSQVHPVLDFKNKTVTEPNAFQINTSIQRCLVKAIALATGIGLHIYAGEDLPDEPPTKPPKTNMGDDVPMFDEKAIDEKLIKDNIAGWKNLCDGAVKKGRDEYADWFPANRNDIVTDCGKKGAAEVNNYWAKKGVEAFGEKKK